MYKVLIVDDEPAAVSLLSNVIQKKCTDFEVQAAAFNGEEALKIIRTSLPDLLLTDIRMPIMDGIELIRQVGREFPDISVVIFSGYSDFEYARSAIIYGAEDYVLKPVDISEFLEVMRKVKQKLDEQFYRTRNQIVSRMVNGTVEITGDKIKKYFQEESYYAAVWRENALPRRFNVGKKEIFSENSPIIVYGRDEMEGMLLCPESAVSGDDFVSFCKRFSKRYESGAGSYKTMVIMRNPFSVENVYMVLAGLNRLLNSVVSVGCDQTITTEDASREQQPLHTGTVLSNEAERTVKTGSLESIAAVLREYFSLWSDENVSQLWLESQVRHIFYQIEKRSLLVSAHEIMEFLLEDAFYEAVNMEDLLQTILSIIEENKKSSKQDDLLNRKKIYSEINQYLEIHIKEPISVQDICLRFGVSKATLSKVFHENADRSFHNYLTVLRVEKAKEIMQSRTEYFIKDVAQEVGYEDQFYFSRIFKSVTGISPSDFLLKCSAKEKE